MGIHDRRTREKEAFRDKVLQTANQMIQEAGIKSFSLRQLAAKLEVSASRLYQFFESKEEIVSALSEQVFFGLARKLQVVPRFRDKEKYLLQLSLAHLEFHRETPSSHEILRQTAVFSNSQGSALKEARLLFESALASLEIPYFSTEEKIKEAASILLSLIIGVSEGLARGEQNFCAQKMLEESVRTLLLGWRKRDEAKHQAAREFKNGVLV